MQEEIDRLRASVASQKSVIGGVVIFVRDLLERVRAAADDPDEIRQLTDEVEASTAALAQAIAVQTPASDEVHAVDGGTGDDETTVDADNPELVSEGTGQVATAVEGDELSGEEAGDGEGAGDSSAGATDTSTDTGAAGEGEGDEDPA
ncbi:MAG: hypothetical protein V4696_03630 [Pseudomonadota bacterium]